VAKLLGAPVILIVEGGIGYTIDRLNLCLSLFREQKATVAGVIINKVNPDKMDKVRQYVGKKLEEWGIPLLGILPYDKTLLYPHLDSVRLKINGTVVVNPEGLNNLVENVFAASLLGKHNLEEEQGVLLVVSLNRLNEAMENIISQIEEKKIEHQPLAGVVITGDGRRIVNLDGFLYQKFINKHGIPVISTPLDTYGTAVQISKMEVKINIQTLGKARRAIELVRDNVDLKKVNWG
jgi:hypothetical protein